jgi:hypothetical protein
MNTLETLTALLVLVTGLLVLITGWYAWSTHRILKQMAWQAYLIKLSALVQARARLAGSGDNSMTVLGILAKQLTEELEAERASLQGR